MSDQPPIARPWDDKPIAVGYVDPASGATWNGTYWVKDGQVWTSSGWVAESRIQAAVAYQNKPPDTRPWWRKSLLVVIIVPVGVVVGVIAILTGALDKSPTRAPSGGSQDMSFDAWIVCQQQMDLQLRAPATAEYPSRREVSIIKSGEVYNVTAWVDAENAFGAQVRTPFTCTATHTSGQNFSVRVNAG